MLSFEDALAFLICAAQPVREVRRLPLKAALGRVLAADQHSTVNVPALDNSAMDGYAVRAAELVPGRVLPVSQRIPAGCVGHDLASGSVARIFTGAPVPPGADAVVMQEQCEVDAEGSVRFCEAAKPGQNIRRIGEDMAQGAMILPAGVKLRAQELALAASAGLPELPVYRRLRVAVFFTGDELRQPGEPLPPGALYNSNRFALCALLEELGCEVRDLGQVPDDLAATRATLREAAADNDLVITSGGVSVGEEDHVKPAVEAEGRLNMWKIAIKPGKPLAFGEIDRGGGEGSAWFVGLPGNPVSAFVTFQMLVRPFILRLQGQTAVTPMRYPVRAAFSVTKTTPVCEFLRVRLNAAGEAQPFPNQGSGVMTSLCWGDGLLIKPPNTPIAPGDLLSFIPFAGVA